jgi:hypothetical protein
MSANGKDLYPQPLSLAGQAVQSRFFTPTFLVPPTITPDSITSEPQLLDQRGRSLQFNSFVLLNMSTNGKDLYPQPLRLALQPE